MCAEINSFFFDQKVRKLHDPSRAPTPTESRSIKKANIELIQRTDYGIGLTIVDIDNDHKEDLLAWNIDGTGRFVTGGIFKLDNHQIAKGSKPKYLLDLGVLNEPQIIRIRDTNYLAYTPTGSYDDLIITQVMKFAPDNYQQYIICNTQTVIHAETKCKHPACKALATKIDNENGNNLFKEIEWPHKYFAEAGLAIFFPENGSHGDFDNSGNPTTIWRIGREGYINQHIYWGLLGQGDDFPSVDLDSRPISEGSFDRHVLAGNQHARLQRALDEQSHVLSNELHQDINLPKNGEFFLFDANNRTYWGWDLEDRFGGKIHITYTNAKKSDYIGVLSIKRNTSLKECIGTCVVPEI
jgi:hypothetical protein